MSTTRYRHTLTESIITVMLLLAFSYQVVNRAFYTHVHILPNGTIVTHAHPYEKPDKSAPVKNHSHTNGEFFLLSLFGILIFSFSALILHLFRNYTECPARIRPSYYSCLAHNPVANKAPPLQPSLPE